MENHGMRFSVDTTAVAKGFRDYKSAVEGILGSLEKFEATVKDTMGSVERATSDVSHINRLKKAVKELGDTKVSPTLSRNLDNLSKSMKGFKAPSKAAVNNTRAFFKVLDGMPRIAGASSNANSIAALSKAMTGFKAPSKAQSEKVKAFARAIEKSSTGFKALKNVRGISGIANELASISLALRNFKPPTASQAKNINTFAQALNKLKMNRAGDTTQIARALTAISGFKAPTAAQIRNLSAFVDAIGRMRVPRNANDLASALVRIARAANSAAQSTRTLRSGLGGVSSGLRRTSREAKQASINMMGVQNAFSATFQAGSLLRSLFGALTLGQLSRKFLDAANSGERLKSQMAVISTEAGFAESQLDFVRGAADRLGLDLNTASQGFGRLSVAAYMSGISVGQSREIFEGFGTAMTVLGTSAERQNDVLLAMQQVMNKGYLSAEELNQQLNEHLPGAMGIAAEYAESLGVTLEEGLKNKMIDAAGVLSFMAKRFKEEFGPAMEEALKRPDVAFTRLNSRIDTLFQKIGEAGVNRALGDFLNSISDSMDDKTIDRYARSWGETLTRGINKAQEAFEWIVNNWDSIEGPLFSGLKILGQYMAITGAFQLGRYFVSPLISAAGAVKSLTPLVRNLAGATAALNATSMAGFLGSMRGITDPRIRRGVISLTGALNALNATLLGRAFLGGGRGIVGMFQKMGTAAKSATPIISRLAGAIGVGLGTAWLIGSNAAGTSTEKQVQVTYSSLEIMRGLWHVMFNWLDETWNWLGGVITSVTKWFTENFGKYMQEIGNFAAKAAFGVWYAFRKAIELVIRAFVTLGLEAGNVFIGIGRAAVNMLTLNFSGAYKAGQDLAANFGKGWQAGLGGMKFGLNDFNSEFAALGRGMNFISEGLNKLGAIGRGIAVRDRLRELNLVDMRPTMSDEEAEALLGRDRGQGVEDNDVAGGSGGRNKQDRAKQIRDETAQMVQAMMQGFDQVDPVGALFRQTIDKITEQADVLLNDRSFSKWSDQFVSDIKSGRVSVDALVARLQEGLGTDDKVFAELKRRYGIDLPKMIQLLRADQVAFEREFAQATNDAVDFEFGSAVRFTEAFGENIPQMAQFRDSIDEIRLRAESLLTQGAYTDFVRKIADGTWTADDAMEELNFTMHEHGALSKDARQSLQDYGMELSDITALNEQWQAQKKRELALMQREIQLGGNVLAQLDQDAGLLSLGAFDREVIELATEAMENYGAVSREQVEILVEDIQQRVRRNRELERERELFENNGVRGYINDINQAGQAVADLDRNFLQSLEDQLFSLGKTGEFSFQAIFDTIHEGMLRFVSQNLIKDLMNEIFTAEELESGNPSILGGIMGPLFGATGAEPEPLGTFGKPMIVEIKNGEALFAKLNHTLGQLAVGRGGVADVVNPDGTTFAGASDSSDIASLLHGKNAMNQFINSAQQSALATQMATATTVADAVQTQNNTGITQQEGLAKQNNTAAVQENTLAQQQAAAASGNGGMVGDPTTLGQEAGTSMGMSFGSTMKMMAPMIGMQFAQEIESPLLRMFAQIAVLIGSAFIFGGGFAEGGISTRPVRSHKVSPAAFVSAPSYAQGTSNTSGIPAILHPNEAVIPLSRNRKVPVEMNGSQGGQIINNNFTVNTPDADSFRRSRQQIATGLHMSAQRSFRRNRG